jgi:hypothetical protein
MARRTSVAAGRATDEASGAVLHREFVDSTPVPPSILSDGVSSYSR